MVTSAALASSTWDVAPPVLVLCLLSHLSGKPILVACRSDPEGESSDRGQHWSLPLCAAPDVRRLHPLRLRHCALARFLVGTGRGSAAYRDCGPAVGVGGTGVAR